MALYKIWCSSTKQKEKQKAFLTYSEKDGGRAAVLAKLGEAVRSHYDQSDRIADDVARLGYDGAAEILRALLPQSKRARSGDLGEILAWESGLAFVQGEKARSTVERHQVMTSTETCSGNVPLSR